MRESATFSRALFVSAQAGLMVLNTRTGQIMDANGAAGEILGAMPTVQAYTREDWERDRFHATVEDSFVAARARIRARALLTAVVILFVFGSIVMVLWMGAKSVMQGDMSSGQRDAAWAPDEMRALNTIATADDDMAVKVASEIASNGTRRLGHQLVLGLEQLNDARPDALAERTFAPILASHQPSRVKAQ